MSSVSLSEFNAAQALLDLQSNISETNHNGAKYGEDAEETKNLFLSCIITSDVKAPERKVTTMPQIITLNSLPATPKISVSQLIVKPSTLTQITKRKSPDTEKQSKLQVSEYSEEGINKRTKLFKRKPIKYSSISKINSGYENIKTDINSSNEAHDNKAAITKVETREIGTQTENRDAIELFDTTISQLYEKIKFLEEQIQTIKQDISEVDDDDDETYTPSDYMTETDESDEADEILCKSAKGIKNKTSPNRAGVISNQVLPNRNINMNANDMVPIGNGNAKIPARIYKYINWNSYTSATRKLLTAVFSRRVLATHSLTGKRSPAFPNKPQKKKLDTALVNDIVQTVVERCRVPENVVRTSITTKCADESKMLRTRQHKKKKRKYKADKENIPSDLESD